MKAYVVLINNCEPYEDNRDTVDSVFLSYRDASEALMARGFKPKLYRLFDDIDLRFERTYLDSYDWEAMEDARILKFEVSEANV